MSRPLPPYPNLEHLKKQAKDLLHNLKQQNPASKLTDAQHVLAREYGFASWPKLKVYVESRSHPVEAQPNADNAPEPTNSSSKVNPFAGSWTANLSKSDRHPSNQFHSAGLEFAVEGDAVTIIDIVVDESGRQNTTTNTILVYGDAHPFEKRSGCVLVAKWRSSHILETVAKKDGEVVGWGTYEVSDDGQTLTISGEAQRIVLDRV